MENNALFGKALIRVWAKIEKNTLFGSSLARVIVKNRVKYPFLLWLRLGQT